MIHILVKIFLIFNLVSRIRTHNSTETPLNREHRVHNIVLYPDKHSWCQATPIVQVVGHPGCNAVKTDNNVCVGACFSYIVPRTVPETPGDVLPYCDSCRPGNVTWKKITLVCNEGAYKNQNLTKYVEHIHDCNCGSCKDLRDGDLPKEGDVETEDDILDNTSSNHSSNSALELTLISSNSNQSEFKKAISGMLLKTLKDEDDESVLENADSNRGFHRNVWKNLLEKVETSNNSLDASNFNEIVKSVENELQMKFNYKRLKQVLLKLKKNSNVTKLSNLFNKSFDSVDSTRGQATSHSKITLFGHEGNKQEISSSTLSSESQIMNENTHLPTFATTSSESTYRRDNLDQLVPVGLENQTIV